MYKGGAVLLCRDVVAFGCYLPTYELVARSVRHSGWCGEQAWTPAGSELLRVMTAGGVAGVASWLVVLPLDLVKSRLQADALRRPAYSGAWHCARRTLRREGPAAFYRGWLLVACRAFPVNAGIFLAYHLFKAHFCFEFK